jgi:hypothetical protein
VPAKEARALSDNYLSEWVGETDERLKRIELRLDRSLDRADRCIELTERVVRVAEGSLGWLQGLEREKPFGGIGEDLPSRSGPTPMLDLARLSLKEAERADEEAEGFERNPWPSDDAIIARRKEMRELHLAAVQGIIAIGEMLERQAED